jgi:hypothetical protein
MVQVWTSCRTGMHLAKGRASSGEVQTASPHATSQSSSGPGCWARAHCRSGAHQLAAGFQGVSPVFSNLATALQQTPRSLPYHIQRCTKCCSCSFCICTPALLQHAQHCQWLAQQLVKGANIAALSFCMLLTVAAA